MKSTDYIYLDYAATTPVDPRVLKKMSTVYEENWGNTTGLHAAGQRAGELLECARDRLAEMLHVRSSELIFTSSATESNNTVIKGVILSGNLHSGHVLISAIEHPSVYNTCRYIEKMGVETTLVPVDAQGYVNPEDIRRAIRGNTRLVAVMMVNNEIGTVQPIAEIGSVCRARSVPLLVDAVQAFGKIPLDISGLPVDFLTASSHKIYGPLGAGLLFIRTGLGLDPLLHGGAQENAMRASTVNLPAVHGFQEAAQLCVSEMNDEQSRLREYRIRIINEVRQAVPGVRVNGDPDTGIPHIISLSFRDTDGDLLAMHLDAHGIAVSTGSSCTSGKVILSRILTACRVQAAWAKGTIRISTGRFTTGKHVDRLLDQLPKSVAEVRKRS